MIIKFVWRENGASFVECAEYSSVVEAIADFDARHGIEGYTVEVQGEAVADPEDVKEARDHRRAKVVSILLFGAMLGLWVAACAVWIFNYGGNYV
jgi:hypothetical protein